MGGIKTARITGSVSREAGGMYVSVRRLAQSLQEIGLEVKVFGTVDDHTAQDVPAWAPVPVVPLRTIGPKQFGYSPDLLPALEKFSPDLTHTHGLWLYPSVATNVHRRRHKVPYVISPHGMLDKWAARNSYWKKALAYLLFEKDHLKGAGCLRALCESEARSMRAMGLKNPIAIIPNGIDLPSVRPTEAPWKGRLEPGCKVLLFLSRIHPKKGLANLLKAWAILAKEPGSPANGWALAIAGWDQGGHEETLKRVCSGAGLTFADLRSSATMASERPAVIFLGPEFNDGKAACYAQCDGFVLPSLSEGLPMVVLEAWAFGKPVLMTPECNLPIGFDCDAAIRIGTSPDAIVPGLRHFLQASDAERSQMGRNGLALAREHFAWPVIARELTDVYRWLLGGGDKPCSLVDY